MPMSAMTPSRSRLNDLQIDNRLVRFVEDEVLPGLSVTADQVWSVLSDIVHGYGPRNRDLLQIRDDIQTKVDDWHKANRGKPHDRDAYKAFLESIGYIVPEGGNFKIETANTDPEIA
ncbi:MAG: malate synthase G, partial [Rhodobacteraceae bacterium]|nr:malate synthase G [Paracoccaceae bacterium]